MRRSRYRSLYWRIGVGFILCIAAVLAVQGAVLLWLLTHADPRTNFTLHVGEDLAQAIAVDNHLDIARFVKERYPRPPRPFYIVMTDGQVLYFGDKQPPASAIRNVLREFQTPALTAIPSFWEIAPYWASPVLIDGIVRGTVAVVPQTPVELLLPQMTVLAVCLLIVGTVLASRFIFSPAHHRLKQLEATAQRLGAGDLTARASAEGGDEVAALAETFNAMASDLAARANVIAQSDRTRRLLLADVSHELMTPLTAVRGYQEKLAGDPAIAASAERARAVAIIGEETLRLERLVRDLLDLARLEGGGDSLEMQDVSVEGLFGRVAARHDADAAARRVQLTTNIDAGAEIVYGDPFRLEQALQNLAANALRHTPAGGTVSLNAQIKERTIVIAVRDTGNGISDEHLPFIFDRFYKVDPSRTAGSEGSGLGLSIVRAIIERHGGAIAVTSRTGSGTSFTIQLPAVS